MIAADSKRDRLRPAVSEDSGSGSRMIAAVSKRAILWVALLVLGTALGAWAGVRELSALDLAGQLRSDDLMQRIEASYELFRRGEASAPAASALVEVLPETGSPVAEYAELALLKIGAPAVPPLVEVATGYALQPSLQAIDLLGRMGLDAKEALPQVRELEASSDAEVAAAAVRARRLIAPEGLSEWASKVVFEIGDEPDTTILVAGIVFGGVATLLLLRGVRSLLALRRKGEESAASPEDGGLEQDEEEEDLESDEESEEDEPDADEEDDDGEEPDRGPWDPAGIDPTPAGKPSAVRSAMASAIGAAIGYGLFLIADSREDEDVRRMFLLPAGLAILTAIGFARTTLERLLFGETRDPRSFRTNDREWPRDGVSPVKSERWGEMLWGVVLLLVLAVPFHTIWWVDFEWWGFWVALGIIDLFGLAMIVVFLRALSGSLRTGGVRLRWSSAPFRPGGTLRASFEAARGFGAGAVAEATLRCKVDPAATATRGDEPASDAEEVWRETRSFPVRDVPSGGAGADISFEIPAEAHDSAQYAVRPVRWQLVVRIPAAGPDFETTFPVPIRRS